eukprot:GEMP01022445.1.p1 GENE.GEMP01022445.1~~GEMP01022445.1.p1  ORF type:complete len:376 (+),score=73.27 GEMP01022445.1:385-1512(+)
MALTNWQNAVRLMREIHYMLHLEHANVCSVSDVRFYSDYLFLATPLFEPGSLSQFAPESSHEVQCIVVGVLCGLEYLHANGIWHRDVKPENVFLHRQPYRVVLGDLGMSRYTGQSPSQTRAQQVCTPNYLSPELLQGQIYDKPSDIWGLGVTIFEVVVHTIRSKSWCLFPPSLAGSKQHLEQAKSLSGSRPKTHITWSANRWTLLDKALRDRGDLFGGLRLDLIVRACLRLRPSKRPTCTSLLDDFQTALAVDFTVDFLHSTRGPYIEKDESIQPALESFQEDLEELCSDAERMRIIRAHLRQFEYDAKRRYFLRKRRRSELGTAASDVEDSEMKENGNGSSPNTKRSRLSWPFCSPDQKSEKISFSPTSHSFGS